MLWLVFVRYYSSARSRHHDSPIFELSCCERRPARFVQFLIQQERDNGRQGHGGRSLSRKCEEELKEQLKKLCSFIEKDETLD